MKKQCFHNVYTFISFSWFANINQELLNLPYYIKGLGHPKRKILLGSEVNRGHFFEQKPPQKNDPLWNTLVHNLCQTNSHFQYKYTNAKTRFPLSYNRCVTLNYYYFGCILANLQEIYWTALDRIW